MIVSKTVPTNPVTFILGIYPSNPKFSKSEQIMIDMCFLQAKRTIAMFWRRTCRPKLTHWVKQMLVVFPLERITSTVTNNRKNLKASQFNIAHLFSLQNQSLESLFTNL
uniref:Uncharacterized protein n=1 Tax=Oryzias latipes TaxID=8090 RepID=A0A3P9HW21_ORYLA